MNERSPLVVSGNRGGSMAITGTEMLTSCFSHRSVYWKPNRYCDILKTDTDVGTCNVEIYRIPPINTENFDSGFSDSTDCSNAVFRHIATQTCNIFLQDFSSFFLVSAPAF